MSSSSSSSSSPHASHRATSDEESGIAPPDAPAVNPFTDPNAPLGVYEIIKMVVMTLTLVPVKIILMLITACLISFFCWLSVVGLSTENRDRPITGCRRVWMYPAQWLLRFEMFLLGFYWIRQRGELDTTAGLVAVAPHTCMIDPLFMYWKMWPSGVSAAGNARVCFVGSIIRASQAILVDRTDPTSRHRATEIIGERARSADPWPATLIFPEGTCTNRQSLITFKTGAFRPGVPIQPVVLRYPNRHFDPSWVPSGHSGPYILYRLLCQFVNHMELTYLPVYVPTAEEQADPHLYARNLRAVMAEELGVSVTQHTYEDCRLQHKAIKDHFPPDDAVIEFGALSSLYGYTLDDIKAIMDRFEALDTDHDGKVDIEEFAEHLGLRVSEPVRQAFGMFDHDDSGLIDLREFLVGLALLNGKSDRDHVFEYAFNLFDPQSRGRISRRRFSKFMKAVFPTMTVDDTNDLFDRVADGDRYITYERFREYGDAHPEYVQVFLEWNKGKNVDLEEWRERARLDDEATYYYDEESYVTRTSS